MKWFSRSMSAFLAIMMFLLFRSTSGWSSSMARRVGGRALLGQHVFSTGPLRRTSVSFLSASSESSPPESVSSGTSYEVDDSDQEAEQHLQAPQPGVNGVAPATPEDDYHPDHHHHRKDRYQSLLTSIGMEEDIIRNVHEYLHPGQDEAHIKRKVSTSDIFCNRELKMDGIRAIGFDMDYTLAQYKQPAFDKLAFDGAKEKLVYQFGYPEAVLDLEYDHARWTRGLIIDTVRGNFLKIDRHKYVRVAYHGFDKMSSTTRKLLYSRTFNKVMSFTEKEYINMDTLFQFVDAHLFACLIDLKDKGTERSVLDGKTYREIFTQVRECIDLCHRDGVIKDTVHDDPEKYIILDKGLIPMIRRYRQAGVKLFLLTNSLWEYTSTAMNYLYYGERVDDERQRENEWLELFDLVIVGSCKPAYMLDPYLNLFRVNPRDGSLLNTDGIYEIDSLGPTPEIGAARFLEQGKTFQGGNWMHLQAMLNIQAGEEILYVGDHLYSDVLRSKRTLGWRSAFVMPELEEEMRVFVETLPLSRKIVALRQLREELDSYAEHLRRTQDEQVGGVREALVEDKLERLVKDDAVIKETLTQLAEEWHSSFHPVWGAMFNAGYQDSRFAFYVQNYACVYTSKATNLGLASTERSFRTSLEVLPHDRLLSSPQVALVDSDPWDN